MEGMNREGDSEVCRCGVGSMDLGDGRVETWMQPSIDFCSAYCYSEDAAAQVEYRAGVGGLGRAGNSGVASVVFLY